jgi:hypothetical protein
MKEMMSKLMSKSDDSSDSSKMDAKMKVLEELRDMATSLMGDKLEGKSGMQKVSVAAPDSEGLKKGLEMAQEIMPEEGESMKHEMDEMSMESEDEDMDLEEIEALMRELEDKRRKKLMQS